MTKQDTAQPRELSITELKQAGGGAIYINYSSTIRGSVTPQGHV